MVKIELSKKYLERYPHRSLVKAAKSSTLVIRAYYHLLKPLFRPTHFYISKVEPKSVKGMSSRRKCIIMVLKDETCEIKGTFDVLEQSEQ
jgi:hypothetical protein